MYSKRFAHLSETYLICIRNVFLFAGWSLLKVIYVMLNVQCCRQNVAQLLRSTEIRAGLPKDETYWPRFKSFNPG